MGGNVGINKANPSRYLEIGGTSNNPQIRLSNSSGTSSLEVLEMLLLVRRLDLEQRHLRKQEGSYIIIMIIVLL